MFVESQSSCYVELRDTKTEIIMNNFIIPQLEHKYGDDVSIELYDKETMTPIDIIHQGDDGPSIVYIEDFTDGNGNVKNGNGNGNGNDEKFTLSFVLKLKVNEDIPALGDLQYVMDALVYPELDPDELDKLDGTEDRMTAEFTQKAGCRNLRSHGRKGDGGLSFNVGIPASIFSLSNIDEHSVNVVAGWATGHEAVTLTKSIEFRPLIKSKVEAEIKDIEQVNQKIAEDMPGADIKDDVQVQREEEEEKSEEHADAVTGADTEALVVSGVGASADTGDDEKSRNIRRRRHKKEVLDKIHEVKHHPKGHHHFNLHKFNKMYEKSGFGQASFTSSSYVKGLLVFIVLSIIVIKSCLFMSKKSKGRRDL